MLSGANRIRSAVRAGAAGVSDAGCAQNCDATNVDGAQRSCGFQGLYLQTLNAERGEGQGYFAYGAGGREFESHLVHQFENAVCSRGGPVAQW